MTTALAAGRHKREEVEEEVYIMKAGGRHPRSARMLYLSRAFSQPDFAHDAVSHLESSARVQI